MPPFSSSTTHRLLSLFLLVGITSIPLLHAKETKHATVSADAALKKLQEGNARFLSGKPKHLHSAKKWRDSLVGGQHPFAVIVSCSDSRVPTELLFDQGFGDLFVIRNAGNIMTTDVLGSIEYAIVHLDCKLVLIMGHESCGAVTAALLPKKERDQEPIEVQEVLTNIVEGLEKTKLPENPTEKLAAGVKANVHWSVKQLRELLVKRYQAQTKDVKVVSAVYDLHQGKVNLLKEDKK